VETMQQTRQMGIMTQITPSQILDGTADGSPIPING
jgi:hypothetical protein